MAMASLKNNFNQLQDFKNESVTCYDGRAAQLLGTCKTESEIYFQDEKLD